MYSIYYVQYDWMLSVKSHLFCYAVAKIVQLYRHYDSDGLSGAVHFSVHPVEGDVVQRISVAEYLMEYKLKRASCVL